MIRVMRNVGVRLWVAVLLAVPAGFYLLPGVGRIIPGMPPLAFLLIMTGLIFLIAGLFFDVTARLLIRALVREGEAWERAGISSKARKKYNRAVRVFDSFLLSPLSFRATAEVLTAALARFTLTAGRDDDDMFRRAAARHIRTGNPDGALVKLWLSRRLRHMDVTGPEQEALTRLAQEPDIPKERLALLTEIFLKLGRADFSAGQVVAAAMADETLARQFGALHKELTGEAAGDSPAMALHPGTDSTTVEETGQTLKDMAGPNTGSPGRRKARKRPLFSDFRKIRERTGQAGALAGRGVAGFLGGIASGIALGITRGAGFLFTAITNGIKQVRERERAGFYLKVSAMGLLTLWLAFFVWNTMAHLFSPKPAPVVQPVTRPVEETSQPLPKPFTIQVAAYLKQSHADRFLEKLAEDEIQARIITTGAGGKTWYLIRVSEFPDKESAAAFGNKLKADAVIDDFFVSNNEQAPRSGTGN